MDLQTRWLDRLIPVGGRPGGLSPRAVRWFASLIMLDPHSIHSQVTFYLVGTTKIITNFSIGCLKVVRQLEWILTKRLLQASQVLKPVPLTKMQPRYLFSRWFQKVFLPLGKEPRFSAYNMLFMSIPRDKTCCQLVLIGDRGITKVFQYNKVVRTIQLGFLDLEFRACRLSHRAGAVEWFTDTRY